MKDWKLMKGFGSARGRSVHQIVLQHATQEIIHQVGEDDAAIPSRWAMVRKMNRLACEMKQSKMQASGAGRDWCEGLIARARKKITSQLHAYLNLRFGFRVFSFLASMCVSVHMRACMCVLLLLLSYLFFFCLSTTRSWYMASKFLRSPRVDLRGGKNPASVLCIRAGA